MRREHWKKKKKEENVKKRKKEENDEKKKVEIEYFCKSTIIAIFSLNFSPNLGEKKNGLEEKFFFRVFYHSYFASLTE